MALNLDKAKISLQFVNEKWKEVFEFGTIINRPLPLVQAFIFTFLSKIKFINYR
jgi:hypothetical protein